MEALRFGPAVCHGLRVVDLLEDADCGSVVAACVAADQNCEIGSIWVRNEVALENSGTMLAVQNTVLCLSWHRFRGIIRNSERTLDFCWIPNRCLEDDNMVFIQNAIAFPCGEAG
jgi:hypothetical protein